MNAIGFIFLIIASVMLFQLPRKWAFLPLIMGATLMTRGQVLELGPLNFPIVRVLATIGFFRVLSKGEKISGGLNLLDKFLIGWAVWLVGSSVFHTASVVVVRVGSVWTELGNYFLFRVFIRDQEDVLRVFKTVGVLLIPVALLMMIERITGTNNFAVLGGVFAMSVIRHGHYRAQGPFAHAILAGTVGAMCFPMALYLWNVSRKYSIIGIMSAGAVVYASGSSGPMMMVFATLFAMGLWRARKWMRLILWSAFVATLVLDLVMKDPVYFLLARIDLTGGSTGWHRAALIQSSLNCLGEWWFAGTDRTRHWMPTGIYSNDAHTDITNHILQMGVWGGLPLVFLLLGSLWAGFSIVGRSINRNKEAPQVQLFMIWTLGAILFGNVTNFFSISYYDQTIVYYYMLLAAIASYHGKYITKKPTPAVQPKSSATDLKNG